MRLHSPAALATALLSFPPCVRADSSGSSSSSKGSASVTPHDSYSSSVGVLGCKIDTNRVAYWPDAVDCTNLCVKLSYQSREVHLLRVDQSGGAHDVSYDAWNYLYTGHSATQDPTAGGGIAMEYENVDASECRDMIHTHGHKLPLSAANSMDFLASCLNQPDSWVAKNYVLYNIVDPICTLGYDEVCKLDWPQENQATCPHTLGLQNPLKGDPVYNIEYPSGDKVLAGATTTSTEVPDPDSAASSISPALTSWSAICMSILCMVLF